MENVQNSKIMNIKSGIIKFIVVFLFILGGAGIDSNFFFFSFFIVLSFGLGHLFKDLIISGEEIEDVAFDELESENNRDSK